MPSKLRHTMGSRALSSLVGSPSLPVHSALMAMVPWQLTLCASWPIAFHCWQCCFIASSCVFFAGQVFILEVSLKLQSHSIGTPLHDLASPMGVVSAILMVCLLEIGGICHCGTATWMILTEMHLLFQDLHMQGLHHTLQP